MQQKYQQLLAEGFYVGSIRPPTVKEPRLRISINALHKKDVLARLAPIITVLLVLLESVNDSFEYLLETKTN